MLRNHIKIAFRNLLKYKGFSLINVIGLSVALAVAMLMLLWVQDEWQKDKFHANNGRLHRVKRIIPLEGNTFDVYGGTPYPILRVAVEELPEVEQFFTLGGIGERMIIRENREINAEVTYANEGYFEAFSFPLVAGTITQFDEELESIAISEKTAVKLFGQLSAEQVIGEPLTIYGYGDYTIVAVFKDYPPASSLQTDVIFSFNAYIRENEWMEVWTNSGMQGGLLLAEGAKVELVQQKIDKIYQDRQEGENKEGILLQAYSDNYLYRDFDEQAQVSGGRITYVKIFGIAALVLLLISCINFVNLATARASVRAKEVGIRKTIGAPKHSLISQFMTEAALVTLISVGLGLLMAQLLLPQAELMSEKTLQFNYESPVFWASLLGMTFFTALLAGAYPSFVLSAFKPMNVLKGNNNTTARSGKINLRQVLVVAQFALALVLIVGALTVRQQIAFIQNKNLGLNKENVIVLPKEGEVYDKFEILEEKLLQADGIANVSASNSTPLEVRSSTSGIQWEGKREEQSNLNFAINRVQQNFLDFFAMEMAQGDFYRTDQRLDTTHVIFNESAIAAMELEDPIGKVVHFGDDSRQIIGVVKDYHNRPLHYDIYPMVIFLDNEQTFSYYVKTNSGQTAQAIKSLEAVYASTFPDVPLNYSFLDEEFQQHHANDQLVGKLANYFALLSILISCLGLLGLATFLARQRSKEIGIRKVLGATVMNIVNFLLKDFVKLVVIAVLIATPIAWYMMNSWLSDFAYHTQLEWWLIAVAGLTAIGFSVLTVSVQSIKAALANPVEALKNE